jgi:hypothetical protein
MELLLVGLFVFFLVIAIVTVVGHVLWLLFAAMVDSLSGSPNAPSPPRPTILSWLCDSCNSEVRNGWQFCGTCGLSKEPSGTKQLLRELTIAERVFKRLHDEAKVATDIFEAINNAINLERIRLTAPSPVSQPKASQSESVPASVVVREPEKTAAVITPKPVPAHATASSQEEPPPPRSIPPRPRRRSFSEVLNAFMEESNIRWGEIIGGLLIIGCSTALVVSLWAQISEIPVLKFLIFTTVTGLLFGIGIYTEHRWKLPTTSRGILTIATLLVPLNFLAIAAVSSSSTSGLLVLGSELLAPAIFLCLVYFAGRIITPGCAHLLAAGILGSSVGQLLVRHFATAEASPGLQVALGAFPVVCYLVAVALALRRVLADSKVDESETTTVFTILGTMSFAALLPFGLLLYKSGPLSMTMMYLAPIVTLWGVPMLATGTVLWRRIQDQHLIASRTAGTALAILGLIISLAGILLAWPNPASIVPAALMNVAILTILAVVLEIPAADVLAASCFALAYHVLFQVVSGRIGWQNWRVESLVNVSLDLSTGWALIGAFAIFLIASDWLNRSKRFNASVAYLLSACLIGVISLIAITVFGPLQGTSLSTVWLAYLCYAVGAFWIGWRRSLSFFSWAGAAFVLFTLASAFAWTVEFSFPWQTALLVHASLCTVAAILTSRRASLQSIAKALNYAALITLGCGIVSFFQTNPWQVTWMQTERLFWISGILLLSLWLNRRQHLFIALQVALTATSILAVKATLQGFDWYNYQPYAFLHPAALQIQATVLALLSLIWITTRFWLRKIVKSDQHSLAGIWKLVDTEYSVDRIIPWVLLVGFVLLTIYGAANGVLLEFAKTSVPFVAWNMANFPHQEVLGVGSWVLLGLLTFIMLANSWERRRHTQLLGALVALSLAVPLIAGRFEDATATATAWRFLAAFFFFVCSVLLWNRKKIFAQLTSVGWPQLDVAGDDFALLVREVLMFVTLVPLFLLTCYPLLRAMALDPVQNPGNGIFALLHPVVSYVIPLVVVALVLVGYAIRERIPSLNFYAGLLINFTVTLAYLLSAPGPGAPIDSVVVIRILQLNAITFAIWSLLWLGLRKTWLRALESKASEVEIFTRIEMLCAVVLNVAVIAPLAANLILRNDAGKATLAAGDLIGWFAFVITVLAFVLFDRARGKRCGTEFLASLLLGVVSLMAYGLGDNGGSLAICCTTVGVAVVAWLMFGAAYLPDIKSESRLLRLFSLDEKWSSNALRLSTLIGGLAVFLSLRIVPIVRAEGIWWTLIPLVSMCVLAACLQAKTLKRRYLYLAGVFSSIGAALWWIFIGHACSQSSGFIFVQFNIVVACLLSLLWLYLELRARRLRSTASHFEVLSYHHVVVFCSLALLALMTLVKFYLSWHRGPEWLTWLAFGSLTGLVIATLWDKRAKYATACLYLLGLLAGAICLQEVQLTTESGLWVVLMFLSFYSLATTLLWHKRATLISIAESVGIVPRVEPGATHLAWFAVINVLAIGTIAAIVFWMDLSFASFPMRLSAGLAVVAQSITFGLFAEGQFKEEWRRASIGAFLVGAVLFGWAWLTPGVDATWLNRSVILMVEAVAFTSLYAVSLEQLRSLSARWCDSIKSWLPWLLAAGAMALMFSLGTEVSYQLKFGAVNIHPVSLVAIGVTLVAAVLVPLLFALSPNHDPLSLSERGRIKYVYAAEVMLSLLFLHVRLTMPWLFSGFFRNYWPLVVMAIAFIGVVSSEALRRRNLLVLAKPIERTGVFLPLLPIIGFWIATSQVDYSSLLFVVGALYGLLSILRKSFVFGALAAVAGNGALWYILHRTADYQFLQHPQLWLVPAALSVLAACYLNEEQLTDDQIATMRYLSLVTIYASSTADIFINGVANSPWLPLILGAFSLAGVFSGIMLRIRGLLLLGSVFLLLSVTTMIWYASANFGWTWLWYVAGIATGATIIFMFAVFEKKRSEVLRLVEGLKEWEV